MKKKFLTAFFISVLGFTILYSTVLSPIFFENSVAASKNPNSGDLEGDNDEEDVKDINDSILFLLMGVDADEIDQYKGIRTDTMMLTNIDLKTGEVSILSLPRDSRVEVRGKMDKLNHAHSYEGVDLTLETVRDFLGIDLEYYVKVDYKAVKAIVEAIGGVEIDVPRRMYYNQTRDNLYIDLQPGLQVLNGEQAMHYLRWRKNSDGTGYVDGDIGRIGAQQVFVEELIKQSLQPRNIIRIPSFIKTYWDYVDTNLPLTQMGKAALAANKIDTNKIETKTVPGRGEYINGISYWVPDHDDLQIILEDMFSNYLID